MSCDSVGSRTIELWSLILFYGGVEILKLEIEELLIEAPRESENTEYL